jgi:hypothetical protein
MLTLGLWANSIWVGVPGLRKTACGCDIVDSLSGETGRSLLQNERPDAMLEDIQRERIDISVQADMCWLTRAQCYTSYGEHRTGVMYAVVDKILEGGAHLTLNSTDISNRISLESTRKERGEV